MCSVCNIHFKEIWGPQIWNLLHAIPFRINYIEKIPTALYLINNIYLALPCEECHNHTKEYIQNNKLILSNDINITKSKEEITLYLFNFHNEVNKKLGKETLSSFEKYNSETKFEILQKKVNYDAISYIFTNTINKEIFDKLLTEEQKSFNSNLIKTFINLKFK
jgi:hypothetical protein